MFREVARKKQILTSEQIIKILKSEKRGVLSVSGENGYPYGLPINFWYNGENGYIYFHSGKKGTRTMPFRSTIKFLFAYMTTDIKKTVNGL